MRRASEFVRENCGDCGLGYVVTCRTKSPRSAHGSRSAKRVCDSGSYLGSIVADARAPDDLHSNGSELFRYVCAVGIDCKPKQQLVAEGDQYITRDRYGAGWNGRKTGGSD